eukprot:NODE_131_length_18300_cov_0.442668.p10 type:complete len:183 gc:universal NODE_131_length_18300_cov_0.442668:8254-7706(-)
MLSFRLSALSIDALRLCSGAPFLPPVSTVFVSLVNLLCFFSFASFNLLIEMDFKSCFSKFKLGRDFLFSSLALVSIFICGTNNSELNESFGSTSTRLTVDESLFLCTCPSFGILTECSSSFAYKTVSALLVFTMARPRLLIFCFFSCTSVCVECCCFLWCAKTFLNLSLSGNGIFFGLVREY